MIVLHKNKHRDLAIRLTALAAAARLLAPASARTPAAPRAEKKASTPTPARLRTRSRYQASQCDPTATVGRKCPAPARLPAKRIAAPARFRRIRRRKRSNRIYKVSRERAEKRTHQPHRQKEKRPPAKPRLSRRYSFDFICHFAKPIRAKSARKNSRRETPDTTHFLAPSTTTDFLARTSGSPPAAPERRRRGTKRQPSAEALGNLPQPKSSGAL